MSSGFLCRDPRSGRGRWAALGLLFVLALLFMDGVEASAWHHHPVTGPDPHCLACRVAANHAGTVPQDLSTAARDLPRIPEPLAFPDQEPADAPHLVLPRLRAPPSA